MTKGFYSIVHRLIIHDKLNKEKIPDIWYKDVGGRERTIDFLVILKDSKNEIVTGRKVHLKLVLLYENGQVVPKQEILRLGQDVRAIIDETGRVTIRFRIEEVSRSHQKQKFIVQVGPDVVNYPLTSNVSPDVTPPIEIRSKLNKRGETD